MTIGSSTIDYSDGCSHPIDHAPFTSDCTPLSRSTLSNRHPRRAPTKRR